MNKKNETLETGIFVPQKNEELYQAIQILKQTSLQAMHAISSASEEYLINEDEFGLLEKREVQFYSRVIRTLLIHIDSFQLEEDV